MPYRINPLIQNRIYHIFTKSIAGYKIFNSDCDFRRMIDTMNFYTIKHPPCKFSLFPELKGGVIHIYPEKIVKIFAYCFMPTHIHLVLSQLEDNGISKFINLILKSYSKYFNTKYKRKGPLWEGRFKNVLVEADEQFLHLTRYIHLNPVSIGIINNPEEWIYSSYREYIGLLDDKKKICDFSDCLDIDVSSYKKFVEERIDYQKELERIKHLLIE